MINNNDLAVRDQKNTLKEKSKHVDMADIKYFGTWTSRAENSLWYEGKIKKIKKNI